MSERRPTPTQAAYLDVIGKIPGMSYRELATAMCVASTNGCYEMVARLRRYGYVSDERGRGIRLAGGETRP